MTVQQGMDTARARQIADGLRVQGNALSALGPQGSAMMQVLDQVWNGPDTEHFAREWNSARPQIDQAGTSLTDMANELARQAEEQDLASEGSGFGPGLPPPVPPLPPLPPLPPPPPGFFEKIGELLSDAWGWVKDGWDWIRENFPIPAWFADLIAIVDEIKDIFRKAPFLKHVFKIFGKITPFVGLAIGLWDMGEAIFRFFDEGFTKDSVLQFFEGLTGAIAGGLGIAAIFATGTIVGAPAGVVLGALALVFGGISIGIGIYRDYDEEIDAFVQEAWPYIEPHLPGMPLPLPQFPPPTIPVPEMPEGPGMPNPYPAPTIPDWPGMPTPTVPDLGWPQVPSLPSLPELPGLPKPTLPSLPLPGLW